MIDTLKLNGPILLVTDLSPRCDRALDRAALLAHQHGLELIALHVVQTAWLDKVAKPAWRVREQDREALAQKRLAEDLGAQPINIRVMVQSGDPADVIEQVAREQGCSIIVSGTARDETLGRVLLGGTVQRLTQRAAQPVLVVRKRPFKPYERVLLATDFSAGSAQALKMARAFCGNESLTLYHALDDVAGIYALDQADSDKRIDHARQSLLDFYQTNTGERAPAHLEVIVQAGRAETCLPELCEQTSFDLVVTGTGASSGLVGRAMGSVAQSLLADLRGDVMVVPAQASR